MVDAFWKIFEAPETILALISIVFVVILGLITIYVNRLVARRRYTLDLVFMAIMQPRIADADTFAHYLVTERKPVHLDESDFKFRENMRVILSYYEILATSYEKKIIHWPVLRDFRAHQMVRFYIIAEPYIRQEQQKMRRASLYSGYEKFVKVKMKKLFEEVSLEMAA